MKAEPNIVEAVRQVEALYIYTTHMRRILAELEDEIKSLVNAEFEEVVSNRKWPMMFLIGFVAAVPIIVYTSSQASYTMRQASRKFDKQAEQLEIERKKTDNLLAELLPAEIVNKLKVGEIPEPRVYESATLFFGDIVGFTQLSAMSTATQTINFLNELYNTFDTEIDKYDVYKVEIVGDGYFVASGIPNLNGNRHASEIANMAICLMNQVQTFKVRGFICYRI